VPFTINDIQLNFIFLLSWKQVFRPYFLFLEHNLKSIQDVSTKLSRHIKQVHTTLMCLSLLTAFSWKGFFSCHGSSLVFRPFLSFPGQNSKSIQDILTSFATHVKQIALMCHLLMLWFVCVIMFICYFWEFMGVKIYDLYCML